jgi:heme A synthase
MTKNMGKTDRIVRLTAAVVIALLILFQAITGVLAIILGIIAIIFVVTSAISFCPIYVPFNISTDKTSTDKKKD